MIHFALALAAFFSAADHPPDPFAAEYQPEPSREVGVGAGQIRAIALGGFTGFDATVRGTLEYTPSPYFGLRASTEAQLTRLNGAPRPLSFRAGIGVHFLPYRRADLGLWFEAGPALFDFGSPVPLLVGGASLELALSAVLFIRLEAQLGWAGPSYLRPSVFAGPGLAL